MASAINRARHILVALLKILAAIYRITSSLNRDSSDDDVRAAFKKVSRNVHPDKGGSGADQTRLTVARPRAQLHAVGFQIVISLFWVVGSRSDPEPCRVHRNKISFANST